MGGPFKSGEFRKLLKKHRITSVFFELEPEDKLHFRKDCRHLVNDRFCTTVSSALWTTAANATSNEHYRLAKSLLKAAVTRAKCNCNEDLAWAHAHLAQLHLKMNPGKHQYILKARHHCRRILQTEHLNGWALSKLGQINQQLEDIDEDKYSSARESE